MTTTDEDFLAHREELFLEFKDIKNQLEKEHIELENIRQLYNDERSKIYELSNKADYLRTIIEMVLKDDVDPFLAKLQYEENMKDSDMKDSDIDDYSVGPVKGKTIKKSNKIVRIFKHLANSWKV